MKCVHTAAHSTEARLVRQLLEGEGLAVLVKGENIDTLRGEIPIPEAMPTVWVLEDGDELRAREVLAASLVPIQKLRLAASSLLPQRLAPRLVGLGPKPRRFSPEHDPLRPEVESWRTEFLDGNHLTGEGGAEGVEPWTCPGCGEEHDAQFGACWNCGGAPA